MCGRYNLTHDPGTLKLPRPITSSLPLPFKPRYNIAPGQWVPVLCDGAADDLALLEMQWGFVPHFVTDPKPKIRPINARSETAHQKPLFRDAMAHRRCLIPATGYYEWQPQADGKQPFHIHLPHQQTFLMAGLWDHQAGDTQHPTAAILTTQASPDLADIHDRMPVVIPVEQSLDWLQGGDLDLLGPQGGGVFAAQPISRVVNSPAHDSPEILTRLRSPARLNKN